MKVLKIILILVFTSLANLTNAMEHKVYKIAVDPAYAPFSFKEDGKFKGIEIDLIDAIAHDQNFKYQLVFMNFDGVIPALVSGVVDGAIDGINVSNERKKVVDFSDGYFDSGLCVVVRDDFEKKINSIADLAGLRVAVKRGTYGMEFAEKYQRDLQLKISYYLMSTDIVQAVKTKSADFFMEDYPIIGYQLKIGKEQNLKIALKDIYGSPQYAFAVKKAHNQELLMFFNQGLNNIKKSGKYEQILNKYL